MKKIVRFASVALIVALLLCSADSLAAETAVTEFSPAQEKLAQIMRFAFRIETNGETTYLSHFGGAYIAQDVVVLLTTRPTSNDWRQFKTDDLVKILRCKYTLNDLNKEAARAEKLLYAQGLEWISVAKGDKGGSVDGDFSVAVDLNPLEVFGQYLRHPQFVQVNLIDQNIAETMHLLFVNGFDMDMIEVQGSYRARAKKAAAGYDDRSSPAKKVFTLKKGERVFAIAGDGESIMVERASGETGLVDMSSLEVPAAPYILTPNEYILGTMRKRTALLLKNEKNAKILGYIGKNEKVFVYWQITDRDGSYAEIEWKGTRAYVPLDSVILHPTSFELIWIAVA